MYNPSMSGWGLMSLYWFRSQLQKRFHLTDVEHLSASRVSRSSVWLKETGGTVSICNFKLQ